MFRHIFALFFLSALLLGALARESSRSQRFSQLASKGFDLDKNPPPYPLINVHLDKEEPSDESQEKMSALVRDSRLSMRRYRDQAVQKRRMFERLIADQQSELQELIDISENMH